MNTEHFRATAKPDRIGTTQLTTHNFEFNSSVLLQIYQDYTLSFLKYMSQVHIAHEVRIFLKKTTSEKSVNGSLHLFVKAGLRLTDNNRNYIHESNFTPRYQ